MKAVLFLAMALLLISCYKEKRRPVYHSDIPIQEDDHFFNTKLTRFSLVFKEGISRWLDSYTYKEKKDFAISIFDLARKYKFKSLLDFRKRKLAFFRMVVSSKNVDKKTKEMVRRLLSIIIKCNKEYKEEL